MSRIAVSMDTDVVPVSGADELNAHLDHLINDPTLALNAKLFDDVELQLTDANIPTLITTLLPKIVEVLQKYQQDPATLCSLAIKLIGPLNLTEIFSLASQDDIIMAMRSPAPSANLLAMTIVEKAAKSPSEAAILAVTKNLVSNFISQWLSAPQVEVGEKGCRVLCSLLSTDCDVQTPEGQPTSGTEIAIRRTPGQGLLWRRIFHDRDIYGLILSLCCLDKNGADTSQQQISLAQGRIFRVLPRLAALNFAAVTRTEFPDLNRQYGTKGIGSGNEHDGLLQFASLRMVEMIEEGDSESSTTDELMYGTYVDFLEALLSIQRITPYSPYKMDTLRRLVADILKGEDGARIRTALATLPERTVPEESDELRRFLGELGI